MFCGRCGAESDCKRRFWVRRNEVFNISSGKKTKSGDSFAALHALSRKFNGKLETECLYTVFFICGRRILIQYRKFIPVRQIILYVGSVFVTQAAFFYFIFMLSVVEWVEGSLC